MHWIWQYLWHMGSITFITSVCIIVLLIVYSLPLHPLLSLSLFLSLPFLFLNLQAFVAHRDIKSQNVLVKSDDTLCLCDFGLAVRRAGDNHVDLISINKFVGMSISNIILLSTLSSIDRHKTLYESWNSWRKDGLWRIFRIQDGRHLFFFLCLMGIISL